MSAAEATDRGVARELAERREYDAAALRIVNRIRSSLDLDELLRLTIEELGEATGASRSLIQLAPSAEGVSLMVEWDRGDTRPLGLKPPTPLARRVFESGAVVVVDDVRALDGDEVAGYLRSVGSASAVSYPLVWKTRVMAVLGFQDSRPREWRDHALPLLERTGEPLAAALAQAEAYEQQRLALEELRNLNRLRDDLIANVSHELRTPLAAVVGSIKTLQREAISAADREELLVILDEQAERLRALTEDLLDFSRYRRGRIAVTRSRIPLERLVDSSLEGIEVPAGRAIRRRGIDGVEVDVDKRRMLQVFSNLVENALRHGSGDVTIGCAAVDGSTVISVSDEGPGADAGYEEEMFLPFSHRSERPDSTGLGLPIARAIVEAHGGTLVYVPASAGRRHQFVITLPRRP